MRAAISFAGMLLWYPLQALVITRILRSDWRRYPFIFTFAIADFLLAVAQLPTVFASLFHETPATLLWRARLSQRGEVVLEFLTFIVVLSLIYQATAHLQSRKLVCAACAVGAVLFVGISFLIHYNPSMIVGVWMAPWTRDLNVGTTILDLALWFLLLARRQKDNRLLLLSGALGIQFTGAAIGNSLRSLATRQHPWPSLMGATIALAAGLVRLYLWAKAFRPVRNRDFALNIPAESKR